MILAAIGAMALTSQAYQFKWGALNVRVPVADNPKVSQTGITVTTGNAQFAAEALTLSLFYVGETGEQLIVSKKNNNAGTLSAAGIFDYQDATYNKIIADTATSSGSAVDFVMRATYTTADGTYDFYQAINDVDITGLGGTALTKNFNMTQGKWDYTANTTPPGPGPIPEPTSGLLLLLGVAGLALRRRRA